MTSLKPCKSCSFHVSPSEKVCPHCGETNPTVTNKDALKGCAGIILLIFILCAVLSTCSGADDKIDPDSILNLERAQISSPEEWILLDKKIRINTAIHYYYFNMNLGANRAKSYNELLDRAMNLESCVYDKTKSYRGQAHKTSSTAFFECSE